MSDEPLMDEKTAAKYLTDWSVNDLMLRFYRALSTRDGASFDGDYFLEKPWHWADDYVIWIEVGKPTDEDDEGWARFEAA